jgi:hypothetical protein
VIKLDFAGLCDLRIGSREGRSVVYALLGVATEIPARPVPEVGKQRTDTGHRDWVFIDILRFVVLFRDGVEAPYVTVPKGCRLPGIR